MKVPTRKRDVSVSASVLEDLPEALNTLNKNGFGIDQDVKESLVQRGGLVRTVDNINRNPGKNKMETRGLQNRLMIVSHIDCPPSICNQCNNESQ
jgi:hypothetical protein